MKPTLVVAAVLVSILATGLTCSGTPPSFSDLRVVSGEVEFVKRGGTDGDDWVDIRLRGHPTLFWYWQPHDDRVYRALKERGRAELWVAEDPDKPRWPWQEPQFEVWQVASNGVVVSSYEDRVVWGESNDLIGRLILIAVLALGAVILAAIISHKVRQLWRKS